MKVGDYIDKIEGFTILSKTEQTKLVSYFYVTVTGKEEFSPSEIRDCFMQENITAPVNISQYFSILIKGKNPVFVKKNTGYTFHRNVKKELDEIYLGSKHVQNISTSLRSLIPKVTSKEQKQFLEEAITCFEVKCYRASIIMAWLLTMDILYELILQENLATFNSAIQTHGKYKKITVSKKEDFSDIKESDFIELLRVSKIISSDIRKILDEKLNFRNTVAHPNTVLVKESKAISFIEDLVENIITVYQ